MSRSALKRLWQQTPLHRLTQGSTLTIRSHLERHHPTHVTFQPAWRNTGHVDVSHIFDTNAPAESRPEIEVVMDPNQTEVMTSLGRLAAHVALDVRYKEVPLTDTGSNDNSTTLASWWQNTLPPTPSHETTRVIMDDGTIRPSRDYQVLDDSTFRRTGYHDGIAHLSSRSPETKDHSILSSASTPPRPPGTYITVHVPEKTNLVCHLQSGSIAVTGKVEGDATLDIAQGDISVTKLRGHSIRLSTGGPIYVSQLLEAQTISIHTNRRLRAKQLHGTNIDVTVDHRVDDSMTTESPSLFVTTPMELMDNDDEGSLVDISSLFVSGGGGATVRTHGQDSHDRAAIVNEHSRRAVRIKSHHGPVQVTCANGTRPTATNPYTDTIYPLVELGGVNGSCEVCIEKSDDVIRNDTSNNWSSCLVHIDSLSPDSISLVTADRGNIDITMDRKAESDLRLASLVNEECLREAGALLAEENDVTLLTDVLRHLPPPRHDMPVETNKDCISIETKAFTLRPEHSISTANVTYVDGWVDNKSDEPDSRFDRKVRGLDSVARGAGKIRHDSAAEQALYRFSDEAGSPLESESLSANPDHQRPLFAVVGTSRISVETVSWLGAIARRYGMDQTADRDLGRTASRRGRPLATPE